jgi:hypothetical protein
MKYFLSIVALILTLSASGPPSNKRLKKAIEKIEREEHSKDGEKVISMHVVILNYSVIPLRNWWKERMDFHLDFGREVDAFIKEVKQEIMKGDMDSIKRKEMEESLKAFEDTITNAASDTSSFDYVAYFKKRYDQTPASLKVYEVKYKLDLQTDRGDFSRDTLRRVLNMKDLSNAHVRTKPATKKRTKD